MSTRARIERRGESGFAVIEALVALALVAVMLAAIGSLVAATARGTRTLEYRVALVHTARLIASSISQRGDALPQDLHGEISGFRWRARRSPFLGGDAVVSDSAWSPQLVEIRIQSPSGAVYSLETVRLHRRRVP